MFAVLEVVVDTFDHHLVIALSHPLVEEIDLVVELELHDDRLLVELVHHKFLRELYFGIR